MKQKIVSMVIVGMMPVISFSQEKIKWTLGKCIDYALEENIQLKQDKISLQESEVDVLSAKADLFPNLSFNTGHNVINRPFQENSSTVSGTEIISSDNKSTYNGNYSLGVQWTLWNGGKRLYNIRQQKLNRQMAGLTVKETENMLKEEITRLFMQILYSSESVSINRKTLETSQATYERAEMLFGEGSISRADLAQLEAQTANDQYTLISSESSLKNYKLQLKQLLELDGTEEMDLVLPVIEEDNVLKLLPNQAEVYQAALSSRPEIRNARLDTEFAELNIKTAKSGYLPTVSLSASTTGNTNSASTYSWMKQMKYGWNNMVGINLSIPIFDNRQNKSNVQKAKLQYDNSLLLETDKHKELYNTIETIWLDALNAQNEYTAADSKLKSCQASFDMVNEQFSLGMKNTVELLTEKNNLLNAQQQKVQAKYMAVLNRVLLDFYEGKDIEL